MTKIISRFLMMTLFIPILTFGQGRPNAGPAQVIVEPIEIQALSNNVEAVGTAEAKRSIDVFPAAADRVTSVNFTPGEWVEKGRLLLQLDARRQTTALQRAKIELQDASRNLTRLQQSSNRGAVTQSDLDDAETIKALAAVALEDAQSDLEDRIVKAPFSGYVGLTDVEVGDRISTNTLITTLDDRSQLFINFRTPEAGTGLLKPESEITVQPWTARDTLVNAQINQIDSRIDEGDRTIRVRALMDNATDQFRPGMSFRVNLTLAGESYAKVPESGLSWGVNGAYVWKVVDNKAMRIDVQIKQRLRGFLLVEGDLQQGDVMVVEGIQRLRPGQAVVTTSRGTNNG